MQRDKIKKVMDACYLAKRVRDLLPKLPNGVTSTPVSYTHLRARDELGLPRPGVTKITKDMEKLGLVEKKAAKTDGRVVFIKITVSGKDLVDKYVDQYFGELSAELDDISDEDADNMIETIEKLYEVMKGRK